MARIIRHETGKVLEVIDNAVASEWAGKTGVLIDPDEAPVAGLPVSQWRVQAGILRSATAAEQTADAASDDLAKRRLLRQRAADLLASPDSDLERAISLFFLDQINALRTVLSLASITPAQMRTGISPGPSAG